jgi:hypothetical protein
LPSAQGWTYVAVGQEVPEASVFSVSGGVLHQNSIGIGIGYPGTNAYRLANVIDSSQPFTISMRARVLEDEGEVTVNSFGFCAAAYGGTEEFGFGLGTQLTQTIDAYGREEPLASDNTEFHDYRLEVTPGFGYQLFRDDDLITTGVPFELAFPNGLELGDGTGGANARAEVASYTFSQGAVPEPGSLAILCLVGASLLRRNRKPPATLPPYSVCHGRVPLATAFHVVGAVP